MPALLFMMALFDAILVRMDMAPLFFVDGNGYNLM